LDVGPWQILYCSPGTGVPPSMMPTLLSSLDSRLKISSSTTTTSSSKLPPESGTPFSSRRSIRSSFFFETMLSLPSKRSIWLSSSRLSIVHDMYIQNPEILDSNV
jgi:hypothetical protein